MAIDDSPQGCPPEVYDIMEPCWTECASERPTLAALCSKLRSLYTTQTGEPLPQVEGEVLMVVAENTQKNVAATKAAQAFYDFGEEKAGARRVLGIEMQNPVFDPKGGSASLLYDIGDVGGETSVDECVEDGMLLRHRMMSSAILPLPPARVG